MNECTADLVQGLFEIRERRDQSIQPYSVTLLKVCIQRDCALNFNPGGGGRRQRIAKIDQELVCFIGKYLTPITITIANLFSVLSFYFTLPSFSGDASSLSAFQRLVTRLRQYQTARDQVEDELHRLRSMGVVDSNNQVVQIPSDMAEMMARVG